MFNDTAMQDTFIHLAGAVYTCLSEYPDCLVEYHANGQQHFLSPDFYPYAIIVHSNEFASFLFLFSYHMFDRVKDVIHKSSYCTTFVLKP